MRVTRQDIQRIEKILFNDGSTFNDDLQERYNVIECNNKSIDVNACPGSGKTTCLLAKLILLSEKMPFRNGKGVCVLTHTNVAIDEVKDRLGLKANILFNYPNHFGTFQSFVDKFLAIPYYSNKWKKRPTTIDSDRFMKAMEATYHLGRGDQDSLNKIRTYFHIDPALYGKVCLARNQDNELIIVNGINGNEFNMSKPNRNARNYHDWTIEEKASMKQTLLKLKKKVFLSDSILSFDDAYFLADEYLKEMPGIRKAFSERFSMVFIDEMQDCFAHQIELLDSLFDDTVVMQKIGDPNQSIMGDGEFNWIPSEEAFSINSSRRFSGSIANVLKTVCVRDNRALTGNDRIENIPPYILVYNNGSRERVIERFAALIRELEIQNLNKNMYPIKAVGWVGDGLYDIKTTIQSYFPSYNKALGKTKITNFQSLRGYLRKIDSKNVKACLDSYLNSILQFLYIAKIKNVTEKGERYFTKFSFLKYLDEKNSDLLRELLKQSSIWSKQMHLSSDAFCLDVISKFRHFFRNSLVPFFQITLNNDLNRYLDSEVDVEFSEEQLEKQNVYYSPDLALRDIGIEVSNIHSVKGETHAATLYLETSFNGKTCSQYIIEQMVGIPFNSAKANVKRQAQCLKMAYVGLSRPKYLLAFAMHEDNLRGKERELTNNGWLIAKV